MNNKEKPEAERISLWLEDASNDGLTSASIGDQHNFRVAAKLIASQREQIKVLREALEYIAKGYSGTVGNCEGHSGTHCAEKARAALQRCAKVSNENP